MTSHTHTLKLFPHCYRQMATNRVQSLFVRIYNSHRSKGCRRLQAIWVSPGSLLQCIFLPGNVHTRQ
uniref:Uncharacterized protein n=1 Tax=Anguilla anguilla TaxID=7936 RepID=A0A0E9TXN7_ANGAN